MKPITTKTGFDCLAFKQLSQDKIAQEMQNLSYVEQVEYLKRKLNESEFKKWWDEIKNQ